MINDRDLWVISIDTDNECFSVNALYMNLIKETNEVREHVKKYFLNEFCILIVTVIECTTKKYQ